MADRPSCVDKGYCEMHEVEIERRKYNDREVDRLKDHISGLLSFKNRLLGVGLLASIIIVASFAYTTGAFFYIFSFTKKYDNDHTGYEAHLDRLDAKVNANERQLFLNQEKYSYSLLQLGETKELVKQLNTNVMKLMQKFPSNEKSNVQESR